MELTALLATLPGTIISKRLARDRIRTPQYLLFLTEPEELSADILYLLDAGQAERVLPQCIAPTGTTVLCAGAVPASVAYQIGINLVSVDCSLPALHNCVSAYLYRQRQDIHLDRELFRRRFTEIIENPEHNDFQVEALCATFPHRLKSSYCLLCIRLPDSLDKAHLEQRLRVELEKLFREDNITHYNGDTIVIHSYDGFTHPPKLPTRELDELMREYDARCGVSNGIRKPARVRLMYILAQKALESGAALLGDAQNIYLYDDTMLFSIVSLMASAFTELYDSDDIIALGCPIIPNIMKHDPNGKRELLETLFQYIIHGKSTSKTAKAMHMHRNTIQNRIATIENLIGDQFTKDGMLQAKLLLTYYILQYYDKVWHKNLVLSPLCEDQEPVLHMPDD